MTTPVCSQPPRYINCQRRLATDRANGMSYFWTHTPSPACLAPPLPGPPLAAMVSENAAIVYSRSLHFLPSSLREEEEGFCVCLHVSSCPVSPHQRKHTHTRTHASHHVFVHASVKKKHPMKTTRWLLNEVNERRWRSSGAQNGGGRAGGTEGRGLLVGLLSWRAGKLLTSLAGGHVSFAPL